jgi:hypothetical protein
MMLCCVTAIILIFAVVADHIYSSTLDFINRQTELRQNIYAWDLQHEDISLMIEHIQSNPCDIQKIKVLDNKGTQDFYRVNELFNYNELDELIGLESNKK